VADPHVVRDYDRVAADYARELGEELAGKPLDRALLRYLVEGAGRRGRLGDLGCGPGHVAGHLAEAGADVIGIDVSPGMINQARRGCPDLAFEVGDLLRLPLPDGSLAGAIAFYSLIHFSRDDDVTRACVEIARVLAPGGEVLVAYHRGDETVRPGALWGVPVDVGFRFLPDELVVDALGAAGLEVRATVHREPYPGEHPSRRAYLLARRR
jgi:ubiquinone/menaquinone biosynthesis C-methylase UbiE